MANLSIIIICSLLAIANNPMSLAKACQMDRRKSDKIAEKIERDRKKEEEFISAFLKMSPQERVRLWKERKDPTGSELVLTAMDDALIALGTDAVPYLAQIVRQGDSYHRAYALYILCQMDRFVSLEESPLPEVGPSVYIKPLNLGGLLNQFMLVDGRRIGKDGYQIVKWAAEQTKDKDLRFHARLYSGLLEKDIRKLSLEEQTKMWRDAVAKSKGILGIARDIDSYWLSELLAKILVERAPESIPPLITLLENDSDGYVREEVIRIFTLVDTYRVRLRGIEEGRKAIESVRKALERGGLKPVYRTRKSREELWEWFSREVFNDEFELHHGSSWSLIAIALERFYGVKGTKRYNTAPGILVIEAVPHMRQFIAYLSKIDPYFPSWEYTYIGSPRDECLHPRFKQKIARYYEQWKRFEAEQNYTKSPQPKTPSQP
jgi:hypothetical protein